MATKSSSALLLTTILALSLNTTVRFLDYSASKIAVAHVGVVYGNESRRQPPAKTIIALCNKHNITRMRLYEPNHQILEALRGSNISLTLGVANEDIPEIAQNSSVADAWVRENVVKYPYVNFRYIAVGNNISPLDKTTAKYAPHVVAAMQNINNAITVARFHKLVQTRINISTAISPSLLQPYLDPMQASFALEIRPYIHPILDFLRLYGYPLLANLHSYFPYMNNPRNVSLDYALFTSTKPVVISPYLSLQYYNLFDVLVDAMTVSMQKYDVNNVNVVVSETGWPTAGGVGATVKNANTFNSNLIKHVNKGTPFTKGRPVETYILSLFDEDLKKPEYNQHWGIFDSLQQLKYPILFE